MKLNLKTIGISALFAGFVPCFNAQSQDEIGSSISTGGMLNELATPNVIAGFLEQFRQVMMDIVLPGMTGEQGASAFLENLTSVVPMAREMPQMPETRRLEPTKADATDLNNKADPRQAIIDITRQIGDQYGTGIFDAAVARAFVDGVLAPLGIMEDVATLAINAKHEGLQPSGAVVTPFHSLLAEFASTPQANSLGTVGISNMLPISGFSATSPTEEDNMRSTSSSEVVSLEPLGNMVNFLANHIGQIDDLSAK